MSRKLLLAFCLSLSITGITGCSEGNQTAQVETEETTPSATETPVEEITQEPEESMDPEDEETTITAPIEVDETIPIEKGGRIAVVAKSTDTAYWRNLRENMQEAVDYLNQAYGYTGDDCLTMTFEGPKTEEDVDDQINIIDAVLSENPAVLCLAAIDVNSCQAQLETAQENGIPVIMFDSSVTSDLVTTYCGTNNRKAGRKAADELCKAIGDTGEVTVFAHENITQTSKERVRGFRKRIKNKHPNVTLTSVNYENAEESLADMARSVIDNNQNLKGIFCTNAGTAEVILGVLEEYPEREIQVVGFDAGEMQKEAIEEGIEYGTIAQDTYRIAYETVWAAARSTAPPESEVEIPSKILVPYVWIDKEKLESEENQKFLYD